MNTYIYCPIEECDYWWAWSGYLDPIIKDIKKHVNNKKLHPDLIAFDTRINGGIVDTEFGNKLAEPKRSGDSV